MIASNIAYRAHFEQRSRDMKSGEIMMDSSVLTTKLASELKIQFDLTKTLSINVSDFELFTKTSFQVDYEIARGQHQSTQDSTNARNQFCGDPLRVLDEISEQFDFIIGSLPLGLKRIDAKRYDFSSKIKENWLILFKSLHRLQSGGMGIFIIEPMVWSQEWKSFLGKINLQGYYVNAYFNLPENALGNTSSIRPVIALISKRTLDRLFIAELDDPNDIPSIISHLKSKSDNENWENGHWLEEEAFLGFHNVRISRQIDELKTEYNEYKDYRLARIANSILGGKPKADFENVDNAIYVPRIGTSPVVASLQDLRIKQQNYYQVVLDSKIILAKYAAIFFTSTLGELVLKSLYSGAFISRINKRSLEQVLLPIPPLDEQMGIIAADEQLVTLSKTISELREELSLNPKSARLVRDKTQDISSELAGLAGVDQIKAAIRSGESKSIEFKQTLSLDVKKHIKERYIETAVLKTIVAFLNTDGGTLLVGVNDNKEIIGLQNEIDKLHKQSEDRFLLHFKNLIKRSIGEHCYPLVNYRLVTVDGKLVLLVECKQSDEPFYLDRKDFYVRTNPATDLLEGPTMVQYIKKRFD